MSQPSEYILLGKIAGVSGIKGWVKVFSHTDPRLQITEYKQWYLQRKTEDWKAVQVLNGRVQGKNIVAQLDGVSYRDQAEALIGAKIAIREDQLKSLTSNEYYWKDLIGLKVETIQGENLGSIDWIFNTGSNDVLTLKDEERTERMIPFLHGDVVKSIDLENNLMVVDWDPEF